MARPLPYLCSHSVRARSTQEGPINGARRCCGRHHERGDIAQNRGSLGDSAFQRWSLPQLPCNCPKQLQRVHGLSATCDGREGREKCDREGGNRNPGSAPCMATSSGDSTLLEAQHFCRTQQTHGPPPTRSGFVEPYLAGTRWTVGRSNRIAVRLAGVRHQDGFRILP